MKLGFMAATLLAVSAGATAAPFTVNATFTPSSVSVGQVSKFTFNAPIGSFCEVEGFPGAETLFGRSGSYNVVGTATLTARVSCERMDTFAGKSATLTVINTSPTVTTTFNPSTVYVGGAPSTFSWSSSFASNCSSPQNGAVSGPSGSIAVAPGAAPSQQSISVTCVNGNGSATHGATLTTVVAPPAPPTVSAWASPDYLYGPGNTTVEYSATNASSCTGAGDYYVTRSTNFRVSCTGPGGTASAYAWVQVLRDGEVPMFASMDSATKNGRKPAISRAGTANLKHLGIDLAKKRYAFVDGDVNHDGAADLVVHDKLKEQVHVILAKGGQFPAISKTVEGIKDITQIKGVFVPLSNNPGEIRVTVQSQQ